MNPGEWSLSTKQQVITTLLGGSKTIPLTEIHAETLEGSQNLIQESA